MSIRDPTIAGPVPAGPPPPFGVGRQSGYVGLMTAASILGVAKSFAYAEVLGVEGFGYYGLVPLVLQFGVYLSNWGLLNALNVELPLAYGRGAPETDAIANRSVVSLLCTSGVAALVYLSAIAVFVPDRTEVRLALSLAALITILTTLTELGILLLRTRQRFLPLGGAYLMRAVALMALGISAGLLWGYLGTILAEAVGLVLVLGIVWRRWLVDLRPVRPSAREARGLIRVGLPLMAANVIGAGSFTIDRIFVAGSLPDEFGQYAFASLIVTAWLAVSGMVSQVVTPRILEARGAGESLRALRQRLLRLGAVVLVGGAVGFGGLLVTTEFLGRGTFSEFRPGLEAMRILYVGGLAGMLTIYGLVLLAGRRFFVVTLTSLLGAVMGLVGSVLVSSGGAELNQFAWVFVASQVTVAAATVAATEVVVRREGFRARGP